MPKFSLKRLPVTVPPLRVPETVIPPMVMTPRAPIITQEDPIEYSTHRDTVEHNNQHPLKHSYPTRITQISQDINKVDSTAPAATRQQHWLINIHEKVNTTAQVIDK